MNNGLSEERSAEYDLKNLYGLSKKTQLYLIIKVLLVLALVSVIIWFLTYKLACFQPVPWPQAFTPILSLGVAIIAYKQWIAARHEISIDKYYDRLESANKKLEVLYDDANHKKSMHVFAQLDKLEYVIIKYELGYMSSILARRAFENLKGHCKESREFHDLALKWVEEAAYLPKTKVAVRAICKDCKHIS